MPKSKRSAMGGFPIMPAMVGFLVSTRRGMERRAFREFQDLMDGLTAGTGTTYNGTLPGNVDTTPSKENMVPAVHSQRDGDNGTDIETAFQEELQRLATAEPTEWKFMNVSAEGLFFLRWTPRPGPARSDTNKHNNAHTTSVRVEESACQGALTPTHCTTPATEPGRDPVSLILGLCRGPLSRGLAVRFVQRIMPFQGTCFANWPDMEDQLSRLLHSTARSGPALQEESTYCCVFRRRYHDRLERDQVLPLVADLVRRESDGRWQVDLKAPRLVILMEVLQSICGMALVPDFFEWKRLNLQQIAVSRSMAVADKSATVEQ